MVEFRLSDDQQQIQDMARKFAQEEFRKKAAHLDEEGKLDEAILEKVWELGLIANSCPESYGGYGGTRSALTGSIMAEELSYGDAALAIAGLSPMLMAAPILEFGTEEQKKEYLPKFCEPKFFHATAALMEPRVMFDPVNLTTLAERSGDKFVLNGVKCMVPLADSANHILVYAATARGAGPASVEAFIVDKGSPGLIVGAREKYMGLRPLPLHTVTLMDCEVPATKRVGGERGINYMRLLNLSRSILSGIAVGVAKSSHDYALNYAKERYAFGDPIASRQAIAFMLAESAMEIDGMRLLAWRAAWRLDRHEDATRDATLAKMYCADMTMKVVDYGVQILGGHGYIREHPVERWFRNGRAFSTLEGLAMA